MNVDERCALRAPLEAVGARTLDGERLEIESRQQVSLEAMEA